MIEPIILSATNADDAKSTFNHWLIKEPVTLLVALGTHQVALQALEKANEMINGPSVIYKSIRVIHAPIPEYIIQDLKQLKANPDMVHAIDWTHTNLYSMLSISDVYNNIGEILSNVDFQNNPDGGGLINKLVRRALTFDKPL